MTEEFIKLSDKKKQKAKELLVIYKKQSKEILRTRNKIESILESREYDDIEDVIKLFDEWLDIEHSLGNMIDL